MKKRCFVLVLESSIGGLLERLEDLGASWAEIDSGVDTIEISVTAPAKIWPMIENEMSMYDCDSYGI